MDVTQERIARAQRGDEIAFAGLVREIRPSLLRWAMLLTGSADDAEDIAQEVVLAVQRGLPSFRHDARFTTWLYSIVRRTAADWRRAQRRRGERERRYAAELPSMTSAAPDGREVERELAAALASMSRLSVRQREAFDLVELQGRTYDDVAELLGLSTSTVRVHVLRARRTLRAAMLARSATEENHDRL